MSFINNSALSGNQPVRWLFYGDLQQLIVTFFYAVPAGPSTSKVTLWRALAAFNCRIVLLAGLLPDHAMKSNCFSDVIIPFWCRRHSVFHVTSQHVKFLHDVTFVHLSVNIEISQTLHCHACSHEHGICISPIIKGKWCFHVRSRLPRDEPDLIHSADGLLSPLMKSWTCELIDSG